MNTTPRRLALAALVLICVVPLAGCVRINRALQINGDGSGIYTLTVGVREPQPNDPSSVSARIVAPLEAFGAHVQATGGSFSRAEDQGYAAWVYTRPFTSVAAANDLLQEDPRQDDPTHSPVLFHDRLKVERETRLTSAVFHITGAISLADPLGTAQSWRDANESVSITLPNGILSQQGGVRQGNTVTYTIRYNQSATIDVAGPVGGASGLYNDDVRWLAAGVLALIALVFLVLGIRLLRRALV
jgi:hypothetical protein